MPSTEAKRDAAGIDTFPRVYVEAEETLWSERGWVNVDGFIIGHCPKYYF